MNLPTLYISYRTHMVSMKTIEGMLEYNREFVREKRYEEHLTSKYPNKKVAIITCMDTRLVNLLPAALGIRNGDVKMIKNAGGMVLGPFDSTVRSVIVSVYELGVEHVMVIGHTDCGVSNVSAEGIEQLMVERGISQQTIDMVRYCEVDLDKWLKGFDSVEQSVRDSVRLLRDHPLIPDDVGITGYIIDTVTGELTPVTED